MAIIAADAMHTKLDDIFYANYDYDVTPQHGTAETADLFNQKRATGDAVYEEEYGGVGNWDTHSTSQGRTITTVRVANQKTVNIANYKKTVAIPVEHWEDAKFGLIKQIPRDMGMRARTTVDENAFAVYAGGFGTTTTADAGYLFANTHTSVSGDTVDNLNTGGLTPDNFFSLFQLLVEQKGQDGEAGGQLPRACLVPTALWDEATEVLDSTLKAETTDNNINAMRVISEKYGGIRVYMSVYVSAAFASGLNSNADTSYYLVSGNHAINRYVRVPASTDLVDYKTDGQDRYMYKGRLREESDAVSWVGAAASNGTT